MKIKSLSDPFDHKSSLIHSAQCECASCTAEKMSAAGLSDPLTDRQRTQLLEKQADAMTVDQTKPDASIAQGKEASDELNDAEAVMDRAIESAIVRGVFGHNEASRRRFMKMLGGASVAAVLGSIIPLDKVKAAVKESHGPLEKSKLKVGFVPITCATPIIMAHPMGLQ